MIDIHGIRCMVFEGIFEVNIDFSMLYPSAPLSWTFNSTTPPPTPNIAPDECVALVGSFGSSKSMKL